MQIYGPRKSPMCSTIQERNQVLKTLLQNGPQENPETLHGDQLVAPWDTMLLRREDNLPLGLVGVTEPEQKPAPTENPRKTHFYLKNPRWRWTSHGRPLPPLTSSHKNFGENLKNAHLCLRAV